MLTSLKKVILIFALAVSAVLAAQDRPPGGFVLDQISRQPVPNASVFINGTSIGTFCGEDGAFSLAGFPAPPFKLTVSAVGYQSETVDITPGSSRGLQIELLPKAVLLSEVTIRAADKNGWEKYGPDFIADFIGYSPFAQSCRILNPQVLSFLYDEKERKLTLHAEKPILIRNDALGYKITYWLEHFEADYARGTLFYRGDSQFQDLITDKTKKKQATQWLQNRQSAYKGSLQHFIRALFQGNLEKEGFLVQIMQRMKVESLYENAPRQLDTVFFNNEKIEALYHKIIERGKASGNALTEQAAKATANRMLNDLKTWYRDSTDLSTRRYGIMDGKTLQREFYEFKKDELNPEKVVISQYPANEELERQASNGMINVVYSSLVPADSLVYKDENGNKLFSFPHFLHITFNGENEEEAYLARQNPFKKPAPTPQTSIISLRNAPFVRIYANGFFESSYDLLLEKYWSYEKLDKLLPLEY